MSLGFSAISDKQTDDELLERRVNKVVEKAQPPVVHAFDASYDRILPSSIAQEKEVVTKADKLKQFEALKASDLVHEYNHFNVYLDIKQYYVGRVFIWAKRADANDIFDLTPEEFSEWRQITFELKAMYEASFKPDKINLAFLGNEMEHCHCHVVPRYQSNRKIVVTGEEFQDENYGHNYSRPNATRKISVETQSAILEKLKNALTLVLENRDNRPTSSRQKI